MSDADAIVEPAATRVRDPISGRSVWLAGLISNAAVDDDTLSFDLNLTPEHPEGDAQRLPEALRRNIESLGWRGSIVIDVKRADAVTAARQQDTEAKRPSGHEHSHAHSSEPVRGMSGPGMQPHGGPITKGPLPGVKHIVAVASGKGGVGKSTLAANLAVALRRRGHTVGVMDADIYGPSIPMMLNITGKPFANADQKIIPLEGHGIKVMSIGFLVDNDEPIIWRGPMVMGVVKQFLQDVAWGDLDVLLIDLPPGTGDAQLTMIQAVELSGAVVITTPQDVALADAVRGIEMFRKLEVPVLGLVENMSWFEAPDGSRSHPFGEGGGQRTAKRYEVPLLAQVPLDTRIREGGDHGVPATVADSAAAEPFIEAANRVAETLGL
jgi:ATP-binding protein involved in chromosome partitioning